MHEMYVVQGIKGGCSIECEFSLAEEDKALLAARGLLKDPTFEGDSVRVITRDGEMVWDSKQEN